MEIQTLHFREAFRVEFPNFLDALNKLTALMNSAIYRRMDTPTHADSAIMSFAIAAYDDFKELLILCESGYGLGAQKQLRSMYEKVLSAAYLSKEPARVAKLHKYLIVHQHKIREAALKLYTEQEVEPHLPKDMEDFYNEIKPELEETACDKCKKKRVPISWYPAIDQMAATVGGNLKTNNLYWYLLPTFVSHASQYGLQQHIVLADGVLTTNPAAQTRPVSFTLRAGHLLLIEILCVLNSHFDLKLDNGITACQQDITACWPPAPPSVN
jgi:hypothetical protein